LSTDLINDRYRLSKPMGEGGQAHTYLAEDLQSRQSVLLKVLEGGSRPADLVREMDRLTAGLHPSLPRARELDQVRTGPLPGGAWFLSEEPIRGENVGTALVALAEPARGAALLEILASVADALGALHTAGFVHGDVTPANLIVEPSARTAAALGMVRLLDLGLCRRPGAGKVAGTPAFMAPEALLGETTFATDLYGLAATIYAIAAGTPPFGEGAIGPVIERILSGNPPPPLPTWVPVPVDGLIRRLLQADPLRRAPSALAIATEARAIRDWVEATTEHASGPPAAVNAPALFGRSALLAELESVLASHGGHQGALRVVVMVGAVGSGRRSVIDEAARRHQMRAAIGAVPALEIIGGDLGPLGLATRVGDDPDALRAAGARLLDGLAQRARGPQGLPIALRLADVDRTIARTLISAALAFPEAWPEVVLLAVDTPHGELQALVPSSEAARALNLAPLDDDAMGRLIGSMLGRPARPAFVRAVIDAANGIPALAVEQVELAAAANPVAPDDASLSDPRLGRLAREHSARSVSQLDPSSRRFLSVLHAAGGTAGRRRLLDAAGEVDLLDHRLKGLLAAGFLAAGNETLRLRWLAAGLVAYEALAEPVRKAIHQRLAASAASPSERALQLVAAEAEGAAQASLEAAVAGREALRLEQALGHLGDAVRMGTPTIRASAALEAAQMLVQLGRYDEARSSAEIAEQEGAEPVVARAVLTWALAAQRTGRYVEALEHLEAHPYVDALDVADVRRRQGLRARVLCALGRFTEAREVAQAQLASLHPLTTSEARLRRSSHAVLEALAVARFYLGEREAAAALFARLFESARTTGDATLETRACALLGMAAHARGALDEAVVHHRACRAAALRAGDVHNAAVAEANLAAVAAERADYGVALAAGAHAVRALGALGATAELGSAMINRARVLIALGDTSTAVKVRDALAASPASRAGLTRGHLLLLTADLLARDETTALETLVAAYEEARLAFAASGASAEEAQAWVGVAEAYAMRGDVARAADTLALAEKRAPAGSMELALAMAAARVALADPGHGAEGARAPVLAALDSALEPPRREGRLEEVATGEELLARLCVKTNHEAVAAERARLARAAVEARVPEVYRRSSTASRSVIVAAPLAATSTITTTAASSTRAPTMTMTTPIAPRASEATPPSRLRRLLEVNKRLNSELRLPRLLEHIVDEAIELCGAERGFVVLYSDTRVLHVEVARNMDKEQLAADEGAFSRSIAARAAAALEPLVAVEASEDERFGAARSVADLHIRSVLAAPLRVKGKSVGALYLDHRLRRGAFDPGDAQLLADLCEQAAIAIDNARLLRENRRRAKEVEELNRKLAERVRQRESELTVMQAELQKSRGALGVQGDYSGIVGRSPRMRTLFHLLDRLVDSTVPVVIYGESGTGKELVARALHTRGPRRERPFVSESCGAIPEALLESVLFGHVRGAFTGADRDRRGLFEVADGGTLFLDEVGEMSAAMQAKLLRVLQEGEFRRVGGESLRRVDVRVVCASNRDLARMVEEGRFRQDLFYRLNVVRVELPPLRERADDVPLLIDHFLKKHSGGRTRALERSALQALAAYGWPGNVRELENEILRALTLGGDALGIDDLSPTVAGASHAVAAAHGPNRGDRADDASAARDPLALHAQVERLERALVREALERAGGNQTQAARLLGLSRFGLQKKLRRYGMAADAPPARSRANQVGGRS
jgi:transcriptional regulator with GAF, ATPase, and Fis domain/tetratricopeptide (TPR) repeat protein